MKDAIIIHCSATRAEQDITAADIESWHRARGFWTIGYHYVIRLDGTIEPGRDVTLDGAHCMGWNKRGNRHLLCRRTGQGRSPRRYTHRRATHRTHPTGEGATACLPRCEAGARTP